MFKNIDIKLQHPDVRYCLRPLWMNKVRIKSCVFILFAWCQLLQPCISFSQTDDQRKIDFLAPQVADFMKYGNIQVPYYTGQSGYAVPLFNLNTRGFSIPVNLNYNSEGFKPTLPTGTTGMNWYLTAAGAVTRRVNREPDESLSNCSTTNLTGFYAATKNFSTNPDASIWNFTASFTNSCGSYNVGYEYEPDEFSYNCMGHSGKFYITYGGNVRVVANEDVKVDLSGFTQQTYANQIPAVSTIKLTTADGYTFTFGGNLNAMDYSWQMPTPSSISERAIVNTWHLTKAKSPDGNQIDYTYKAFNSGISNDGYINDPNFYVLNKVYSSENTATYNQSTFSGNDIVNQSGATIHTVASYSLTKTSYLESISTDDFNLHFQYSQKARKFYYTNAGVADASSYHKEGLQLDAITLNNAFATEVKKISLYYTYLGGSKGSRHMLTSINDSGVGTYTFAYYRTSEFPGAFVHTIDHWGFWKGGDDEGSSMIPAVTQASNGDQVISSSVRDADTSYCNVGLLQQVVYPTGGSTTFQYEGHQYAYRLERIAAGNFLPQPYTVTGVAGGARIRSITDAAAGAVPVTRTFKYTANTMNNGTSSSGFLLDWPRYIYYWKFSSPSLQHYRLYIRGSSFHTNYNTNENYINYSEVTEENANNGYKVMKFNNYLSNPDYADYTTKDFDPSFTQYIDKQALYRNYVGFKLNDRSQERGLNTFEGYYNSSKTLVKSVETTYPEFSSSLPYFVRTLHSGMNIQAFKVYTQAYRPTAITTVTNAAPAIVAIKTLSYDELKHNLRTESLTSSNGKTLTTTRTYPNDYAAGTTFIDEMKTAGQTGLPIEKINYQTDGSANTHILSGQLTEYYTGGKARPEVTYQLETDQPVSLSAFKFSARATGVLPVGGSPAAYQKDGRYQPVLNYRQYDSRGNLLEKITSLYYKGRPTAYKWGYNDQYPIAEIKNSKLNDVYLQDFELYRAGGVFDPIGFENNIFTSATQVHTGYYSSQISNSSSSEITAMTNQYLSISPGTKRKFTYSGWVYSDGPSAQLHLFMYRDGETGYFSYVDNADCYETGKWVYVTKTFQLPDDVVKLRLRLDNNGGGNVWFDDLAIRPAEAQLKTFTYYPFIGMRSKIEGNGQTTFFEYDNSQRLKTIKDQHLNILKTYGYHILGQ